MLSAGNEGAAVRPDETGAFAPLREPAFRRIWFASLLSNLGQLIMGVGAAWEMTRLSSSPSMVALVQTASMLPLMLVALPAGAMADMYDRRKIALAGLTFAMLTGALLTSLSYYRLIDPVSLLALCFLIGTGVAVYVPAWQAAIGEQVSTRKLPAAVALGAMSYNVARSFGPAVGGLIVLALGARAAFAVNVVLYLPLWFMYFVWRRVMPPSRLPPERIDRAIVAGLRYARHSVPIRTVVGRSVAFGLAIASVYALTPLVAKELLGGNAGVYGILLGAFGIGSVIGATQVSRLRQGFSNETIMRAGSLTIALCLPVVGLSHSLVLTCAVIAVIGFCTMIAMSQLNVSVQLSAPRWVTARALSLYTSAITGGMAIGAWGWGVFATHWGVSAAFIASGLAMGATLLLGGIIPLPRKEREEDVALVDIGMIEDVALDLTLRSGPVVIEVEYDVDPDLARDFHAVMSRMGKMRTRIGGFEWSISRDIAHPERWIERYACPTWGDYLRMRDRYSQTDRTLQAEASRFHRSDDGPTIRRFLERPYGSVRWKAESHDPKVETIGVMT